MEFRIIIGLALVYQANPWEIYDPPRGGTGPGWNYVSPPWTQPSSSVVFRRPMDAMVDLTNDLGVAILQDYSYSRSNFAFSPYGVASVLVVLYEGARGESARQIHTAVKFPWDRDITRIGFRDIHRHLRSYFSHEGYLSGITLNKDGAALKPEYKRVLRFYGYDVDVEPMETTTRFPYTTTTKFTQVPIVTRTTTTTTTTTTEAVTTQTQTTPKVETTTKGTTATTIPQMPETESPKPKEEEVTTTFPTTTTTIAATTTTKTTTTTPKPETTTVKMETTSSTSESSSIDVSTDGNVEEKEEPEEAKPEERINESEKKGEEATPEEKSEDEPEKKEETEMTTPEEKTEDEPEKKEEPEEAPQEENSEDKPEKKEGPEEGIPEEKTGDEPEKKEEPEEGTIDKETDDELDKKEEPENTQAPPEEKPAEEPEKKDEPEEPAEEEIKDRIDEKEEPTTEKQITIPAYSEEPTESSDEMEMITPTTTAFEKSEETSDKMEPDESQSTTPNDINIDNGMLIPQPEGATPLSLHNLNTMDSQQLPLSNPSDDPESRIGIDNLMEETATRTTTVTILPGIETTQETTPKFEVKKRSPNTNPQHYLWEPKTLDEYLIKKRNDQVEDITYVNPSKEISIKSLEEYLSLKNSNSSREGKHLKSNTRPMKLQELLCRRHKQMFNDKSPISFHTNVGFEHRKGDRERRTISDFLKIPPVPDLSLQLQNGMFDSHVSRGADLYRTLPRSLFLVDGAVDTPVPVMSYTSVFPFAFIPRLHSTALEFPLDDERYKLLIILPVERRGLRQLMYDLSACPLRQVLESLRPTRVKATVPTFMVEGFVILTPTLQKLGIWDVFDPRRSNLSGMSTDPELYVRNIEQSVTVVIRNYVEILDIQTRTMAARGVEQEFTATHPFLYFVLDSETNVALMAGQILDPLNSRIY